MRLPRTPLLRPSHFHTGGVSLTANGLVFDHTYGTQAREAFFETSGHAKLARGEGKRRKRGHTRVVINPTWLPADELVAVMGANHADRLGLAYGMPNPYERTWAFSQSDDSVTEEQSFVAVAFDQSNEPVGYVTLRVALLRVPSAKSASLHIEVPMVYVETTHRGHGYGIDLSLACGDILCDVLRATCMALRAGWTLSQHVSAEYETAGGATFVRHVERALDMETFRLRAVVRQGVELDEVDASECY